MLAAFLQNAVQASWQQILPGVEVCHFSAEEPPLQLPAAAPPVPEPGHREVLFCRSGTLLLQQKEQGLLTAGEGDIVLLSDCSALNSVQITPPFSGVLVTLDGSRIGELLALLQPLFTPALRDSITAYLSSRHGCAVLQDAVWSRPAFAALETMPQKKQGAYCVLKCAELLFLLGTDCPLLHSEDSILISDCYLSRTIADIRAYMEAHLEEKLTIDFISRHFHISSTAFKTSFRQMYNQPVHRWLQAQRMKRAAELLRTTPMPILQIAEAVGYEGSSQFNVVFKRHFGMTPRQYKNMSVSNIL